MRFLSNVDLGLHAHVRRSVLGNGLGNLNLSTSKMLDFALMIERHRHSSWWVRRVVFARVGCGSGGGSSAGSGVLMKRPPGAGEDWMRQPGYHDSRTGIVSFLVRMDEMVCLIQDLVHRRLGRSLGWIRRNHRLGLVIM